MGVKAKVFKFGPQDKSTIRGKVKHTRTGACSAPWGTKCFHGKTKRPKFVGKKRGA